MPIDYRKYPANWKTEIRPEIMKRANNWKEHHWAKSNLSNDDSDFFKAIRMKPFRVATTSFTGNDICYYKRSKVVPWNGSFISLFQQRINLRKRK